MVDFGEDYAMLGRRVRPAITARKARESVELLLKLGMIRREGPRYVQTEPNITTGDTVESLAVENFHLQNLKLAGASMDTSPAGDRDISCMVVGVSREGFERIKAEVAAFRSKLVRMIDQDAPAQRVYHIAFQVFPTSDQIREAQHATQQ